MNQRYDFLFDRIMESAKPAIAIAIIYAIAFYMGWDKPYWASVSAASVNLLCHGMTLYRGVIRVAGTIVGGFTGLAIIALFPQERWAYHTAAMIPILMFGYGCSGKNGYFYVVCGITFMVVMAVAWTIPDWDSGNAHQIAMLRITQTWMGSLVMVLVNVFVWPKSRIGDLRNVCRQEWGIQRQIYSVLRRTMSGEDTAEEARRLRLQDIDSQETAHFLHHMSAHDSFEMIELGHQWHEFLHLSAVQVESMESLRESLGDVEGLDLAKVLPGTEALFSELDQRFEQSEGMMAGRAPTFEPEHVTLSVNEAEVQALPHFQQSAVAAIKAQLENFEAVSRSLFGYVAEVTRFKEPHADHGGHDAHGSHGSELTIDPDRALSAIACAITIWVAYLCWIYIYDVPVGPLFWAMAGIFIFIMSYRGEVTWREYFWSWGVGTAVAGICYLFIMQHLSGYRELGTLIFVSCFLMFFTFFKQAHPVGRMFALISFCIILSADNEQHYSLEHFITYALWLFLCISIPMAIKALFFHPRPEKMFLRFLDRFFRHAQLLISAHGPEGAREPRLVDRWKMVFYRQDLTELPRKISLYASNMDAKVLMLGRGTVDYKMLETAPELVQEFLMSLYLLAYRVKDLVAVRQLPRMEWMEEQLLGDLQEWQQLIQAWFRCRGRGSTQSLEQADELAAGLAKLEPRIDEAFAQIDTRALSVEDYENFYRLLSSYRSLSEAVIDHVRIAESFDWSRWRETRF